MQDLSTLDIKVQKFVHSYGADMLIAWLDQFDNIITVSNYPLYRTLLRESCKACDITIADMKLASRTPCVNAKRIVSFIATQWMHLSAASVAMLLGISERTVNYYVKEAQEWIDQPMLNKTFFDAYHKVTENFKIQ